ncbi:beta-N-acetylhexosaminidase [Phenylobacterium sp. J426]|uniref:beta-N-acetylhexosaminidase n=1 Tax=Phenylobacterium sp. J426 TaxID=2898439 RepID=UPI002151DF9E|nr:beta-N-acetylhexosaminidase [Phenylobacterium sp. J426]MCR5876042.1 beta-N-acetylhexosaminidase [Phenylobacterium sp. J426]
MSASAAILGCSGLELTAEERAFFRDVRPWGFILFGRNIDTPDQVRRLTAALRETVGRENAPILIDQEGGRIQRLGPPHWRTYPTGRAYGQLPAGRRREMTRLGARLIAHDLAQLGINVDCVPVLDVPDPQGHEIIGDRAYGDTPEDVALLGRAACEGLIAGGVLPVVKHIPGHGRARADSHLELPVVEASFAELNARDFAPFRALSDMPMAMTAHVIYTAVDAAQSATTSEVVFEKVIRGAIGFDGLVMCDDLSMKALSGPLEARAALSLAAGCDVVLHCNGDLAEMRAVIGGAGELGGRAAERARAALSRIPGTPEPLDHAEAVARFEEAFR